MSIRTGGHYKGQAEGHFARTRLTESVIIDENGDLQSAPAGMVMREDGNYNYPSGQIVPFMRREDIGWQNLTYRNFYRDLPPAQQEKMISLSFWLYRNNAMAKRIIGMLIDFVWGDGLTIHSKNTSVKDVLDDYWFDPRNNWPLHGPQRFRDLFIYGEWLHRPRISTNGKVAIDVIQPDKIKYVIPSMENHEDLTTVVFKGVILPGASQDNVTQDYPVKIIHPTYNEAGDLQGWEGDVFYFGINRTTDTTRGVGELFPLIDYIDLYDDVLFNRAERIATSAAMWWDLEMQGFTQQQITAYLKDEVQLPPKPGSVWAHNEKSILKQQTPSMGADDHERDVAVIRSHIIATAGFTGTMFDAPGDAGRAVGAEMAESVYKAMKTLQEGSNQILRVELDYVLWQAKEHGKLSQADIDDGYTVGFPVPSARDISRTAPAMYRLSQAIHQLILDRVMSPEQARQIITTQVNKLGLSESPFSMDDVIPPPPRPPAPIVRPAASNVNGNANGNGTVTTPSTAPVAAGGAST